jgi:hypothetical protein
MLLDAAGQNLPLIFFFTSAILHIAYRHVSALLVSTGDLVSCIKDLLCCPDNDHPLVIIAAGCHVP